MTTSNTSTQSTRVPLRLRMAEQTGRGPLDGGWWPQSRDLTVELADLVNHFPKEHGRVIRAIFSPPDWDPAPRRVPVRTGYIDAGSSPHDDTHVMLLRTSDRRELCVLVIPPDMTPNQGDEALLAAATPGYAHSAASLLAKVTETADVEPGNHWNDDGGSFWGSDGAPSFRTKS